MRGHGLLLGTQQFEDGSSLIAPGTCGCPARLVAVHPLRKQRMNETGSKCSPAARAVNLLSCSSVVCDAI